MGRPKPAASAAALPIPTEDQEQMAIFYWAGMAQGAIPELALLYAIPNGGKRAIATAKRMKATGTKAGIPDICLPVARGGYHGLYVELKRVRGGMVSDNQRSWIQALTKQGYKAVVCRGSEEAIRMISEYLEGER